MRARYLGWASLVTLGVLALHLALSAFLGMRYSPKALVDRHPSLTIEQLQTMQSSPMVRFYESLAPVHKYNRYIIPGLFVIGSGCALLWWRVRSNRGVRAHHD